MIEQGSGQRSVITTFLNTCCNLSFAMTVIQTSIEVILPNRAEESTESRARFSGYPDIVRRREKSIVGQRGSRTGDVAYLSFVQRRISTVWQQDIVSGR